MQCVLQPVSMMKLSSLLASCGHKYSAQSIIQSELRVLRTLNYRLWVTTPLVYVETLLAVLGRSDCLASVVFNDLNTGLFSGPRLFCIVKCFSVLISLEIFLNGYMIRCDKAYNACQSIFTI